MINPRQAIDIHYRMSAQRVADSMAGMLDSLDGEEAVEADDILRFADLYDLRRYAALDILYKHVESEDPALTDYDDTIHMWYTDLLFDVSRRVKEKKKVYDAEHLAVELQADLDEPKEDDPLKGLEKP